MAAPSAGRLALSVAASARRHTVKCAGLLQAALLHDHEPVGWHFGAAAVLVGLIDEMVGASYPSSSVLQGLLRRVLLVWKGDDLQMEQEAAVESEVMVLVQHHRRQRSRSLEAQRRHLDETGCRE